MKHNASLCHTDGNLFSSPRDSTVTVVHCTADTNAHLPLAHLVYAEWQLTVFRLTTLVVVKCLTVLHFIGDIAS